MGPDPYSSKGLLEVAEEIEDPYYKDWVLRRDCKGAGRGFGHRGGS